MIRIIVNLCLIFLLVSYDRNQSKLLKTIETKIVDIMPEIAQTHKQYRHGFVYNFLNLTHTNIPTNNFLAMKNATEFTIKDDNVTTSVLPTLDYQALYIFVFEGSVFVQIRMCEGGMLLNGGHATKGWNLISLNFPRLLHAGRCGNFSMDHDRPSLFLQGSARLLVWKTEVFCFFASPTLSHEFSRYLVFILCVVSFSLIFKDIYDNLCDELEESNMEKQNALSFSNKQIIKIV